MIEASISPPIFVVCAERHGVLERRVLQHPAVDAEVHRPGQKAVRADACAASSTIGPALVSVTTYWPSFAPAPEHSLGDFAVRTPGNSLGQVLANRGRVVTDNVVRKVEQRQRLGVSEKPEGRQVLAGPVERKAAAGRTARRGWAGRGRLRARKCRRRHVSPANHARRGRVDQSSQAPCRRAKEPAGR